VLVTRPSEAEARLSFAGLADLLDEVGEGPLAGLPAPQRRALEVALVRVEPTGVPPEPLAIAAGLLRVLRLLAVNEPVLLAIDDLQWLDSASADALAYAARRALDQPVRLLLSRRSEHHSVLERAIAPTRLEVGALGVPASRRLLFERLGLTLPRPVLKRLVDAGHGNPLVTLELGRVLLERGTLEIGTELPAPELADELFGARVRSLPEPARRTLLTVALSAYLSWSELAEATDPAAIEEGVAYGVLSPTGERMRALHPLLAAAARAQSTAPERRDVHLTLSQVLGEGPRAARHLALATAGPDAERAGRLAGAAAAARSRGAAHDAVELAEHALRLTPPGDPNRNDRSLALAEYLLSAGSRGR
jgi:hypothetical protein